MALGAFVRQVGAALRQLEGNVLGALGCRYPDDLCLLDLQTERQPQKSQNIPQKGLLDDILGKGILWAVPKHRRSIEKRHKRKYGSPEYVLKILLPRRDLKTCNTCGDDHEAGVLCPTCYKKVIDETRAMQDTIQAELKLEPVEKEVVVLYEGEKDNKPSEFWEGKRIVEMEKPRPSWFSENLLQKSTQKPSETKDVKPSELG